MGAVVLNGVTTTADISPSAPTVGSQFNVTNYQTTASLPESFISDASALGSTLTGSSQTQLDMTGATPATMSGGTEDFTVPIPSPPTAETMTFPASPEQVGPFTATQSAITVQEDTSLTWTINISSSSTYPISCNAYPNMAAQTGIGGTGPTGNPIDPVIALAGGGATTTTSPPTSTTTTAASTTGTVSSSSSGLAFTGTGPGLRVMAVVGSILILLAALLLLLVTDPRRLRRQFALVGSASWARIRQGVDLRAMLTTASRHRHALTDRAMHRIRNAATWLTGR